MLLSVAHWLKDIALDFLAPRTCELCGKLDTECHLESTAVMCQQCADSAEAAPPPDVLLNRLARAVENDDVAVTHVVARYSLRDDLPMQRLVYDLKYGGRRTIALQCGQEMARCVQAMADDIDIIIPVPLHPARLRDRGFNQAELLAETVAKTLDKPYSSAILKRVKNTMSQTSKNADERRTAMLNVFDVKRAESKHLLHKHILLIDDVWTTGSTMNACALALLYGGAKRVSALALCAA